MSQEHTEETREQRDFFISYGCADRHWAEWIVWLLEEAGYTTVMQAWNFRAGGNFVLEMDRAARRAQRTIAVLFPNYLASRFTPPSKRTNRASVEFRFL